MTKEEKLKIIAESIGQASMCWHETPKGVFDDTQALKIINELYEKFFPAEVT